MRVFLIHGMGRTHVSLSLLGRRLKAAGHQVVSFNYFVTRETLEAIANRFAAFVAGKAGDQPFAVVGHSLGNIITRMCLGQPGFERLERFVMLAPPNQPPVMAKALEKNPVFRALTRDAGQKLIDEAFYATLAVPAVPTLVVAGNKGPRAAWLPFRGESSDGVVRVAETRLPAPAGSPVKNVAHVEVPAIHTFIMNEAEVARLVLRFLDRATLEPGAVLPLDEAAAGSGEAPRHPCPTLKRPAQPDRPLS